MKKIFSLLTQAFILSVLGAHFAHAAPKTTFENWLQEYGAWDRLEQEYAKETNSDSPEVILKRAEVYLNLNSPNKALELVEMTSTFADNATEAERLWIGGQAHRALGDLSKAVLWFTQASKFMTDPGEKREKFKNETGLQTIWKDVWLKMYWAYVANHSFSRGPQKEALENILAIGQSVWDDTYWEKANAVLNPPADAISPKAPEAPQVGADGLPIAPFVTDADTSLIAQALALVSLEKYDAAIDSLSGISQEPVKSFWQSFITFFDTKQLPKDLTPFDTGNYLKATAFWQGNLLAPYSASHAPWVLGNPESGPWTKFRNNLLSMSSEEANKAIDNELGSMLISEQTAVLLNSFKLALSLSNGNGSASANAWNKVDKTQLPFAIQLAGALVFNENLDAILPSNPSEAFKIYPIFSALLGAAGHVTDSSDQAPFWISVPADKLEKLSQRDWPLDKLLLLANWQQAFDKKPTNELAKRSAFLFKETDFGVSCLLHLADQAVRAKHLQLGAFYLNQLDITNLSTTHKMVWLDVKTRLELDSGRIDTALKTFSKMNELNAPIPVMTRLRMALLYQQRRNFTAAREQLMAMWNNRTNMTTTLQAETLFWLGEGEQAVRNTDKALDYYLKLAWQYPQENIWALTAMYRASIIYEKQGKYDTAKRMLKTVVKRADRKEQREAAKARIAAIDKKMGTKSKGKAASTLVYPF